MAAGWSIEERTGTAAELHASWDTTGSAENPRSVAVCRVTAPAVVLGSTQPDGVIDAGRARRAGIQIARRRSGGGAVLVAPGDPVWVDAWVPRGDRWWLDDVSRAFDWFGTAWAEALRVVGCDGVSAHRGGFSGCSRWSSLICFGGVGTGEVVHDDGRKLVGLSQRRTREGAWFHSACVLGWRPDRLLDVLDLSDDDRTAARSELATVAAGVNDVRPPMPGGPLDGATVVAALLAALP
ncbi:MAG: lipoyl protein ligase domain-containing protein [Acidimicrobiales bacterium]